MKKLFLGNVITADDNNPTAQAIIVNDGVIEFVGGKQEAINLAGDCEVVDYKDNYIYPGFIESHCHGYFAGYRAAGQGDVGTIMTSYEDYIPVIKKYIKDHPEKDLYIVAGWNETGRYLDHKFLDDILMDKPLLLNTAGGHSLLLNTKGMEMFHIDKEYVAKHPANLVHRYENGEPTGYICEEIAVDLINNIPVTTEDAKKYLLKWQDMAIEKGYTTVCDAGTELMYKNANEIYKLLDDEKKLKLKTCAFSMVADNVENPTAAINKITDLKKKYDGDHFMIIGAKVFLDGVGEARTSWTCDEYANQKGYYGLQRFADENKMVELITQASKNGLSVHCHSEGDGATKFILECIKKSQAITNDIDQRNIVAHLHYVKKESIEDMKKTNSIPLVPPLWIAKFPGAYEAEEENFGVQRTFDGYPVKSFFEAGCKVCYHTDYPISPLMDVARTFYMAERREVPEAREAGIDTVRNITEGVTSRMDSLKALTINPAYELKQDKILGSIEVGKLADLVVMDKDMINCDINDLPNTKLLHTIIEGEVVYSNN